MHAKAMARRSALAFVGALAETSREKGNDILRLVHGLAIHEQTRHLILAPDVHKLVACFARLLSVA